MRPKPSTMPMGRTARRFARRGALRLRYQCGRNQCTPPPRGEASRPEATTIEPQSLTILPCAVRIQGPCQHPSLEKEVHRESRRLAGARRRCGTRHPQDDEKSVTMRFMTSRTLTRRDLVQSTAVLAAGVALTADQLDARAAIPRYGARPPAGFVRTSIPGRVVRVNRSNTLQANGLWPKPDAAKRMLEGVMSELTGETDMARAFGKFVHPEDVVAIKPNIGWDRAPLQAASETNWIWM